MPKLDLLEERFPAGKLMPSWGWWAESTHRIFQVPHHTPCKALDRGSVLFRERYRGNPRANTSRSAE